MYFPEVFPLLIAILKVSLIVTNSMTERLAFTAGFQAVVEDEGKSLDPSPSSSANTLLWCLRTYLLMKHLSKNKMAADDECVTLRRRVTLAELAPGRLNKISQFIKYKFASLKDILKFSL